MAEDIYALGESAYRDFQKMRALMNIRDVKRSSKNLGQRTVLVECISETPASGNSVLASECYSGLLLQPLSTANGTLANLSTVWLTLYDGNVPGTPVQNQTYLGIMTGDVTLDVDANTTNITRPRVFGVPVGTANAAPPYHNILINGHFNYRQRFPAGAGAGSTVTFATGNYGFDRWYMEHNANATGIALTTATIPTNDRTAVGSTYGEFKNVSGNEASIVINQPVIRETTTAYSFGCETLTFTAIAKPSSGAGNITFHMAVFEWNGTADNSSCKQLVASWSGNSPVFNTANHTEIANTTWTGNTANWTRGSVDFTISANATNIVPAIWVEGLANNSYIWLAAASLHLSGAEDWIEPDWSNEADRALYYYWRPNIRFITDVGFLEEPLAGNVSRPGQAVFTVQIPSPMRKAPTVSFNPTLTNLTATMAGALSDGNIGLYCPKADVFLVGNASTTPGVSLSTVTNINTVPGGVNPNIQSACVTIGINGAGEFYKPASGSVSIQCGDAVRMQINSRLVFDAEI